MKCKNLKNVFQYILKLDIFQELIFSLLGCLCVIFIFQSLPETYHLIHKSRSFKGKIVFSCIIIFFFFSFIILNQSHSIINFFKVNYKRNIIIFSIFNFTINYFLLFNADFINFGLAGDNYYRTAYITHMANSGYPQDYCYKGLSGYYFPLYYYLLALYARVFQIQPYKMLRYGFLFLCYFLPIILFESWKKIYNLKIAFVISIVAITFFTDSYTIAHVVTFILLIPFILYYFENYRNKNFKKRNYIIGGLLGSFLFCTYLTYFFLIPVYFCIKLVQNRKEFKKSFKHIIILSFLILLFSCWYLIPLFIDIMKYGIEVHQNNYLTIQMLEPPIFKDLLPITFIGIFVFIGFAYLVVKNRISRDLRIYRNLLVALFILVVVGFICVLINHPLYLYYRFFEVILYVSIIPSCLFCVKIFPFLKQGTFFKKNKIIIKLSPMDLYILILILFTQTYYNATLIWSSPQYKWAFETEVPKEDIEIFEELDYEDKVFLTNKYEILCYLPIFLFICPYPHFSHPSALHNQRVKFLIELSECDDSNEFYDMITDSKFGPIDYFYLQTKENSTDFKISVMYDKFLDEQTVDITFKRVLFENDRLFKEINIDGEIIYETKY